MTAPTLDGHLDICTNPTKQNDQSEADPGVGQIDRIQVVAGVFEVRSHPGRWCRCRNEPQGRRGRGRYHGRPLPGTGLNRGWDCISRDLLSSMEEAEGGGILTYLGRRFHSLPERWARLPRGQSHNVVLREFDSSDLVRGLQFPDLSNRNCSIFPVARFVVRNDGVHLVRDQRSNGGWRARRVGLTCPWI